MVPFSSLSRLALLQVPGLVGEHSGVRDGPSPRGFSSGTSEVVQCNTEIPGGLAARRLLMRSGRNVRNACPHFPATPYQLLHDNYGIDHSQPASESAAGFLCSNLEASRYGRCDRGTGIS